MIYCIREDDGFDTANMIPPTITHSRPSPPSIKAKIVTPPLPFDPPVVPAGMGVAVGVGVSVRIGVGVGVGVGVAWAVTVILLVLFG